MEGIPLSSMKMNKKRFISAGFDQVLFQFIDRLIDLFGS